jgi:ribA/ribD-fused uncharacterized protein
MLEMKVGDSKMRSRQALLEYVNRGEKVEYLFFWGHERAKNGVSKSCLSQWYASPFECEGYRFPTAEHYMMYRKARLFGDSDAVHRTLEADNPGKVKAIGREIRGFDQESWNAHRFEIVLAGNLAKFSSDPVLRDFLLGTGKRVLVEASPVDKIWGIGMAQDNPSRENPNSWKGLNLLGFALMGVRDQLSQTNHA